MIWKNIRIWTIHSKTECMQRRVKLSRFSLAFEIDFFCLTKSPAPHLPGGLGQFYHFVAPSEGSSSWARLWQCLPGSWRCPARKTSGSSGWPRPRSGPEQACSLCHQLNFVKRWVFLNQYHMSFIVEYARTGDGSDFWHVQDESGFYNPYCSQTIGHRGY